MATQEPGIYENLLKYLEKEAFKIGRDIIYTKEQKEIIKQIKILKEKL